MNIVHHIYTTIAINYNTTFMLDSVGLYLVIRQLLHKGLINYYHVNKIILHGCIYDINPNLNNTNANIHEICIGLLRQTSKDIT